MKFRIPWPALGDWDVWGLVPKTESVRPMSKVNPRLLLWVDAVGGFLLCQAAEIRLGQAIPDNAVDVPLVADLSRHHATIRRDEEGYTIEPLRDVWLNEQRIRSTSWLSDGALVALGSGLKLRFRRPHPLSATARLDFVSHHRTQPSTQSILLMADTCLLGPGAANHVVCRHWPHDVVLFREHGLLRCKSDTPFEVDGHKYSRNATLKASSKVSGEQFTFGFEEIA